MDMITAKQVLKNKYLTARKPLDEVWCVVEDYNNPPLLYKVQKGYIISLDFIPKEETEREMFGYWVLLDRQEEVYAPKFYESFVFDAEEQAQKYCEKLTKEKFHKRIKEYEADIEYTQLLINETYKSLDSVS